MPEPDADGRGEPVAATAAPPLVLDDPGPGERTYFLLIRGRGASASVAERRIPLEGAANFRDLGGYATGDGRHVRWGRVYRSDAPAELSDDDVTRLRGLGLRLVCDLRSPVEREEAPDRLPEPAPEVLSLPIHDAEIQSVSIRERLLGGELKADEAARLLLDGNVAFATTFRDRYAAFFRRLLEPEAFPALVHCTAGKDRAGFASALLLLLLGVRKRP